MPYKHPNGTTCMTVGEFWAAEAEKEGKQVHEVMDEFYGSLAKEEVDSANRLMNNLDEALGMLNQYYDPEYVDIEFQPISIIKMIDASVSIGMRKCSTKFVAKVKCSDGVDRYIEYSQSEYSGSFYDPPDFDCECKVLPNSMFD
jgi:hypothetical protein